MKLDEILENAIVESAAKHGSSDAATAIVKLVKSKLSGASTGRKLNTEINDVCDLIMELNVSREPGE